VATTAFDGQFGRERFRDPDAPAGGHETTQPIEIGILPAPSPKALKKVQGDNDVPSTERRQEAIQDVDPLIRLTPGSPERRFHVLQQWECVVDGIEGDSFTADLLDLTDPSKPREIVEIPLIEISEADLALLLPGAVFYWILGYEITRGGQKRRVSEIRARRNPKWSQRAIDAVTKRGEELYNRLKGNGEDNST